MVSLWWEGVDSCNSEVWHLCIKHFAPPPRRWFMQYKVLQLHQRCSKSSSPTHKKKAPIIRCFSWWEGVDSCNSEVWHLCIKHFAPPPRRWFMQYKVLQLHQRCSKSSSPTHKKKAPIIRCFSWWEGVDSNHRSH